MTLDTPTPVLGFAAFSGTGKTTLLRQLIPLLRARGLRLGLLKHSHHAFKIDKPGKDSDVLSRSGATQTMVASPRRTVIIKRHAPASKPGLTDFLEHLEHVELDLIIVEGFKHQPISKIELHRPSLGHPLLCLNDPDVIAVATDAPLDPALALPVLDLNNPRMLADFILRRLWPRRHCDAQLETR